jgi:SAM-dependent methyltransferase
MKPAELAAEFAKLGPWIFQFRIEGHDYGGGISAAGDARIEQFFRFAPNPATILELGALEGAHTVMLAEHPGVQRVLALEGREANLRKARFVQEQLKVKNAEFGQANLEHVRLAEFGTFDVVFCSGLLYHLPEPWKLIEQFPAVAPAVFIWTQYAAEEEAKDIGRGLRGKIHVEGGPEEPLSGMSATSIWLTLASLRELLRASGYQKIDIIHDDPNHANGPAVTICARMGA